MERDLYLTEAPLSQTPDTTTLQPLPRQSTPVKSLSNPNDRRNQVSKKILSNFPLQSYYDDKKIKPGISLYKLILQTEDKRRDGEWNGPFLKLNLHPTVAFTDNVNSMIYCDQGTVKIMNYVTYEQFLGHVSMTEQMIRDEQSVYPAIMTKCCNGITFEHTIVMNNEVSSKVIPRSENVISTKFIIPYASYPNIIRLFFTPKTIKTTKKNIAYKVINRKQMTQDCFRKKHRLSNQFMVQVENQESYIATLMKGKALEECETMAASLCEYLQSALMIAVTDIVIDFIVDDNKTIFFNDIKSISSLTKKKLWQIGTQQQIIKLASQNNNQIMCRLCGMLYTKKQMEKLVTNKLIYELVSHLENRKKKLLNIPHMKKEGLSNVCSLCYQLIKAEHELINVERQFSELMNIRQGSVERVQSKETKQNQLFFYDEEEFQMLGEQTSKYKKWRLFFYVEKLKRIQDVQLPQAQNIEISLEMKFQNNKEKFTKIIPNQNYTPTQPELTLTKTYSKSLRTTHNFKRQSSASSRKGTIRVQSAMPHRQKYRQEGEEQRFDEQCPQTQLNHEEVPVFQKNKSYFNDQTTCVTHSQSYFSNGNNRGNFSTIDGANNTTLQNALAGQQNQNILQRLDQNANEDSFINNTSFQPQPIKMKKISSQNYDNNLSSVPSNIKIDKVKMFVFYTKAHQNSGKNILADEQVEFSLTMTQKTSGATMKEPSTVKFTGTSSTLSCLKNKETCQRHSLEIYLFDDKMKYCNLELTVGMVCDGLFDDEGLDLEKCNNLYWGKMYSCDPLPDEWMEVFTNGEEVPKGNMEKVLETLEKNNFSTSPPKLLVEKTNSVNYLSKFQQFAQSSCVTSSLKSPSGVQTPLMYRPMSGLPASQSTSSLLKKTSAIRCKTAINRQTSSYSNLYKMSDLQHKSSQVSTTRGKNNMMGGSPLKEIIGDGQQDEEEFMEFGV